MTKVTVSQKLKLIKAWAAVVSRLSLPAAVYFPIVSLSGYNIDAV